MSFPQSSHLKSDAETRPEVFPKPSKENVLPGGDKGLNIPGGKVRSIVDRFSQHEPVPNTTGDHPTNGTASLKPLKLFKRGPTPKPKPGSLIVLNHVVAERVPPLPTKRTHKLQKQTECLGEDEGNKFGVEGGRPAPDGKEVEIQVGRGGDAEADSPLTPSCDPNCSCVCHHQRPGMKLIWVPVDLVDGWSELEEEDAAEGDQDWSEGQEGESEAGDEVDRTSEVEKNEVATQKKKTFHHTLDVLIADGHRRRSDPGLHSVVPSFISPALCPWLAPTPRKFSHPPPVTPQGGEESIYEATISVAPKKPSPLCKELDTPLISVRKPARRSRLTASISDPTSQNPVDDVLISSPDSTPPAIPPRVPLNTESCTPTAMRRSWIPLPPLPPEERHLIRTPSPNQLSITPRSSSPLLPVRPPPPPPKAEPRRTSDASLQLLKQTLDGVQKGKKEKEDLEEEQRPVAPVRRESSFRSESLLSWESRLQDEPLYQTYRDSVIIREIRRQTVCRNISKTSADYNTEIIAFKSDNASGGGTPRSSPVPTAGQSTLWQDLPDVRQSGILEKLTADQIKYQESMFEVLTSETSYLRSLRVLTEHFLESRELVETLIIRDKQILFSNILRVREVSERFLKDLEDRIFSDVVFTDICDIIHYHAQHNFPAYIDYVRNQIFQEKAYNSLMKNNVQFAMVLNRLQESPLCQRLPFSSFLLLPFQRITRIKMLIENVLRRTKEGTKEEQDTSKALASVSKIIDECNSEVGKMRQTEELIHLSKTLEFDKLRAIPIVSANRYLEKKGELQEMSKSGTIFNMRARFNPMHLFLFNDLLIIAVKKSGERFVVTDHAHRSLVQVQPVNESGSSGGPFEHCFNLTLLENHQGRIMERLVKAPSQSDMDRWLAVFPDPTKVDREETEVIYDEWDCPQVQCVDQYVAQQADELSLEPTDIINVIRKTTEGWYEGFRLSDGQKGWFPVANVLEITNEHVRRRNLRERYRVMQAASMISITRNRTMP
ncbi:rho guanine nucleotide exchange factor 15 [Thalassophryne amazonica]|uniref:rho guanine nucleotide exchange factor 15 n=1 Tax=Thalassophryne amazonica TaxID=390379 RepID=UPI0014723F14|nr:rho guanine nucleotide exchange factor 15 [Thalassophryne amazonica]